MTTANPAFEDMTATEGEDPRHGRGRGKRLFLLIAFATVIGFVAARMRHKHHASEAEESHGS